MYSKRTTINGVKYVRTMQNRRNFLHNLSAVGATTFGMVTFAESHNIMASQATNEDLGIQHNDVILFQGDSLTDGGRDRSNGKANSFTALGDGYVGMVSAKLLTDRPDDTLEIYNRGIGGNTVPDLLDRWQEDCLKIKPDVLSILIGVNDVARTVRGTYGGDIEKYSMDYRRLLERTLESLPKIRLVIGEPFLLVTGKVDKNWRKVCDRFRDVPRTLAEEFNAIFIPYQTKFDAAVRLAPPEYWTTDGIHPTAVGKALMAYWWNQAVL